MFLTLLIIFISINIFQSHFNDDYPHYKLQYSETTNITSSYNGIIIGTSHATHSIRPSYLDSTGISFYNLSLNGSNPEFYLNWYSEIFEKYHPKIKYCIISVDNYFIANKGYRELEQDSEYFPIGTTVDLFFSNKNINKTALFLNSFPALKYRTRVIALTA